MLVVLKCILLYNKNGGFTLSKPYFRVCCKSIYLWILFLKSLYCLIKNGTVDDFEQFY
jgi:hypothetical protein